jgi:hypothetical protein
MIGMPAPSRCSAHLEFLTQLPSYQRRRERSDGHAGADTRADLQMLMAYQMAGYTRCRTWRPCIQYIQRLPKDMGVTYISSLLRRDYKGIINQPAMQAWINKNAALVSIISSSLANSSNGIGAAPGGSTGHGGVAGISFRCGALPPR